MKALKNTNTITTGIKFFLSNILFFMGSDRRGLEWYQEFMTLNKEIHPETYLTPQLWIGVRGIYFEYIHNVNVTHLY